MIGASNVQGIIKPEKQNAIKHFVIRNELSLVVLVEKRVKASKYEKIRKVSLQQWDCINNYPRSQLLLF